MKKKIIIVEDDPDILFAITMMLENNACDVTPLSSARTLVQDEFVYPDLFILDKRMPDMDGLEVCKHLRSQAPTQHIPIIVISATPRFGPLALKAGANDFIEKPFEMSALVRKVEKYLRR